MVLCCILYRTASEHIELCLGVDEEPTESSWLKGKTRIGDTGEGSITGHLIRQNKIRPSTDR